jgi:hypothetical protein
MDPVALALADVEYAFLHLEFAIKLMCYCESGHLDIGKFDTDVTILLDKGNVGFPQGNFATPESVVHAAQANVGVAFGVSAVALDSLFEAAGIPKQIKSRAPIDELRTFVYMVRCAFAHNFADPRWQASGPDFARLFALNLGSSVVLVDLSSLHGQSFEYTQMGGFAQWFSIKKAVTIAVGST